jgi:hypothetical protein
MNKLYLSSIIFGALFVASNVFATVGGPILIHSFKYNPADESVYYVSNSYSGRGCPPELLKMSLNSGKVQVAFSCDEGEKLLGSGDDYNIAPVNVAINKITQNFKDLIPINLKTNRISVDVSFLNYEKMSPEWDEIKNANFTASVYQDNKKIIDIPISGCSLEQPFVFAGYAIPGFDKKIVLLLSAKGDCWEGGYIYENLYVVGGVNNLDKTYNGNFYKGQDPLVPNEGTLVVFEADSVNNKIEETDNTKLPVENSNNSAILYIIFGFVIALGLGYFLGKKSIK